MPDYSRDHGLIRPHDLVWAAPDAACAPIPAWVSCALAEAKPWVVRRAARGPGRLPVGMRGASRGQRHAGWIDPAAISRRKTPEALACRVAGCTGLEQAAIPALRILPAVAQIVDRVGWRWGVTGAVGFQMAWARATHGRTVCHRASDLDLLIRTPTSIPRAAAAALRERLGGLAARCDVQLETPAGGVALTDWAGGARRVLVKSDAGPFLTADPWARDAAVASRVVV